ncbi:hypothetical protein FB107DRAFT_169092, partial [Schizophyllum commune]
ESPTQFAGLDSQRRAQRASAEGVSPSPSTAPHNHAARKPPDKMSSNGSGPCQSIPHLHCASVLSAVPDLRSSCQPESGSGPDSANGRAREWPDVLMQREIDHREGGEQNPAPSCKDFDFSIALNGREHSSRSDVAYVTAEQAYRFRSPPAEQGRASELHDDGAGDLKREHAGGQTAVLSRDDVKLRHAHSAEEHAPPLFTCSAAAHPKSVSSSSAGTSVASSPAPTGSDVARGSDSPKDHGIMSSVTPTFSPAHVSPDLSCALSRELNARNLRGVDVLAIQEAQVRPGSECRGKVLAPSRDDAQATAPRAPSAARAINALGARAVDAAVSGEFVAEECEQWRILDFMIPGGSSAVNEERDEAITCKSPADARDLTSVALPCQFGEKVASPNASSHAHAMVETRARISLHSSREDEKRSPRSAEPGREESPARFPDLDDQHRALQTSADSLSPSPSTAPCRQAARKPPDKTTVKSSSLHRSESGPDSANWRARGRPTALSPRKVNILEAGLRSKSIGERERASEASNLEEDDIQSRNASGDEKGSPQDAKSDTSVVNFHHPRLEVPTQASAQYYSHAHAGGQVLASSRRDGNPKSLRSAGKCLPQGAKSSTASTVRDTSFRAQAMVKPCTQMSLHSCPNAPECSPPSAACDGNEEDTRAYFLNSNGQCPTPHLSAHALLSLPSTASRILAACGMPEKTSDCSSPDSCRPSQETHPASVQSSVTLPRSCCRSKDASEPDSANWRVRPVAPKPPLREIGVNLKGARNRKRHSPQLDVADTAAPRTFRLHFNAFEGGLLPEPQEDGMSDLKRVDAGGQTVRSSCKDVKPLDSREDKKDPPQVVASYSQGQRLPSSTLNPSTPSTCGRGNFALRRNGSSQGGRDVLCCSPDSSPLSARAAEIIEQPYESGSGAEDEVGLIGGRGDDSPDAARDCGHHMHSHIYEDEDVFALLAMHGPPDKPNACGVEDSTRLLASASQAGIRYSPDFKTSLVLLNALHMHQVLLMSAQSSAMCSPRADCLNTPTLVSPRKPPDKQLGGDIRTLSALQPPRTTRRLGEKISLAGEDRGCVAGHIRSSHDDSGGPTDVASLGDVRPPSEGDAQGLFELLRPFPPRKLASFGRTVRIIPFRASYAPVNECVRSLRSAQPTHPVESSRRQASASNSGASAQIDAWAQPVCAMRESSEQEVARRLRAGVRRGCCRNLSTRTTALKSVPQASRVRSSPRALALLINFPFLYAGEISLILEASVSQRLREPRTPRRTYCLFSQKGTRASTCAKTETRRPTDGRARDGGSVSVPEEPAVRVAHELSSTSHSAGTIRDSSPRDAGALVCTGGELTRPTEATVLSHSPIAVAEQGGQSIGQAFLAVLMIYAPRLFADRAQPITPSEVLLRAQESGGRVSRETCVVYKLPHARQMLRHRRCNSRLIDSRLDRRRNVGPHGPPPGAHCRLAFSLPATPSHSQDSTHPPSHSFRVSCCHLRRFISALRLPVHLALVSRAVMYSARCSGVLLDGIYIRSTPPDPRGRTANGGAQGEVLPSGREEDMTSVLALARWRAGRDHLLDRGAPR